MSFPDEYRQALQKVHAGTMSADDLAGWHRQRLRSVLHHVTTRSAFYRRHLAGIDLDQVSPQTLSALPFTTKDDLRAHQYDVLCGDISEAMIFYESTGTTGPPTPCPRGEVDIVTSNAPLEESWRRLFRAHFGDRMPVIGLMGPSELYAFGDVFTAVSAALGACHAKLWPDSPRVGFRKALQRVAELGIEVVVCTPAMCLSLANAARHLGYDVAGLPVSLFLVLGEICTREFAANVASVWPRATVKPTLYGSQEALCIATGAADGRLYLSELNYLVELVDPDTGAPLGDHGEGELVLTMLVEGIKPLIRYRTGDVVRIAAGPAGPGMPGPAIEVVGRAADRLRIGGTSVYPAELEAAVLDQVRGCLGYQVVIGRAADGADELTVHLDMTARPADDLAAVAADVTARVSDLSGARVRAVAEVGPAADSFVSWKAARILDDRASSGRPAVHR